MRPSEACENACEAIRWPCVDAARSLFNVQLQYTQTQQVEFQAMINLYLAMGGGWVSEAEKVTDAVARTDPGVAQ